MKVTSIITSRTYDDKALHYHITFKRGHDESGVELTQYGSVADRYDATDDELAECKRILKAYQLLRKSGVFSSFDTYCNFC